MNWDGSQERRTQNLKCGLHEEWLGEMRQDLKDIKIILTGNGHPENGLVFKNEQNTQFRKFGERVIWLIVAGSITGIMSLVWKVSDLVAKNG